MKTNIIRHGDVSLHVSQDEKGEIIKHEGSFTLALGEVTGHSHVISTPKIEDMEVKRLSDGSILLTLKSKGTLTHQEHKTLEVPAGTYKIAREREYNYFEKSVQRVQD